jgi:hypothetical protein
MRQLIQWIDPEIPTLLAVDAPLGWPRPLGQALARHRAGQLLPEEANRLFRRYTDVAISTIKQPLDVGADRIARTAHQALKLLSELAEALGLPEIPLAWSPQAPKGIQAIEVYPAATLAACKIPIRGYKDRRTGESERYNILTSLRGHITFSEGVEAECVACADVLDAVVCLLAGADFLAGRATPPPNGEIELVQKEGWIWCRAKPPEGKTA